jgi:tetratricopeptide (TPR) repeat protein
MKPDDDQAPREAACPRCGRASSNPFGFDGLCLRCAGVRVLELESGEILEPHPQDKPLERIGPYEIIEELGHGGMGRVFAARQPGLGRIVAVKAIQEGLNAGLDLRFHREIQTAARLRHANIVVVHDSGRADGRLYFSMDYIEGGDLAARLKVESIGNREAATLVAKVADGLGYSHEQGVLHRDLKPSNILLDGTEPKIADFGLSAQIEAGGDLTAVSRLLGTPHYLAPEAIAGGSACQSVASDIYSLGVILFEMLTGRTPFAGASAAELPALVGNSDPPSVRLLAPAVPRDLETICLKCLDRDASRRYATAGAVADDLRRFLSGQAIVARPASTLYRMGQFGRRHRLAMGASALVALTFVGATGVSLWLAAKARRAELRAAAESATSKSVVEFLQHDLLEQAAPDSQPDADVKLRTVVDRAAASVAGRFKGQPEPELAIRQTLELTYDSMGDYEAVRKEIDRVVELCLQLYGPDDRRTLKAMSEQALVLARLGRHADAERSMTRVIASETQALGADDRQTLHSTNDMVFILHEAGGIENAGALAKEMIGRCTKALGPDDPETLAAEADLSSMYFWQGRYSEAEPLNELVLEADKKSLGPEHPTTLSSMSNLAAIYSNEDKIEKAMAMDENLYEIRKVRLGPDHPDTLRTLNNLGAAYRQGGLLDKAKEANTLAYEGRLRLLGPGSPDTFMAQSNLVWARLEKGDTADADSLATQGVARASKTLGADHIATLALKSGLSEVRRREGRLDEAQQLRSDVYASRLSHGGPANYNTLVAANALGLVQIARGDFADAEKLLRPAMAAWQKTHPDNWRSLVCASLLGTALSGERQFAEAEPLLVSSSEALEKRRLDMPVIDRRGIAEAFMRVAASYKDEGRDDQALAWSRRAAAAPK